MLEKFNVPGLYYFAFDGGRMTHIGRTNLAGCLTECGVPLIKGQVWRRQQPETGLCQACVKAVHALVYQPGLRA